MTCLFSKVFICSLSLGCNALTMATYYVPVNVRELSCLIGDFDIEKATLTGSFFCLKLGEFML